MRQIIALPIIVVILSVGVVLYALMPQLFSGLVWQNYSDSSGLSFQCPFNFSVVTASAYSGAITVNSTYHHAVIRFLPTAIEELQTAVAIPTNQLVRVAPGIYRFHTNRGWQYYQPSSQQLCYIYATDPAFPNEDISQLLVSPGGDYGCYDALSFGTAGSLLYVQVEPEIDSNTIRLLDHLVATIKFVPSLAHN